MATTYEYFSGTAKWLKATKPDPEYDNYSVQVYLDHPSWKKYETSGLQMTPKEDQDGKYVTFRRPDKKIIKDELVKFGPPKVLDANGDALNALVGNGSTVTIKVVIYDSKKGKGHRLEAVRVDNLIRYEPKDQEDSAEAPKAKAAMPF